MPLHYLVGAAVAFAVFILVFIRTEAGLYLVLFSMLLSPEFGAGPRRLAEGRTVSIRLEDILLIVITLSWLAKMSMNKDLGLAIKTRLNRPIVAYVAVTLLATLVGYLTGTIRTSAGWLPPPSSASSAWPRSRAGSGSRRRSKATRASRTPSAATCC